MENRPRAHEAKSPILLFSDELTLGGLERVVYTLARGLRNTRRWNPLVHYFETPDEPTFEAELERLGVSLHPQGRRRGFSRKAIRSILRAAIFHDVRVIHTHDLGPLIHAAFAKLLTGGKIAIVHTQHSAVHGLRNPKHRLYERLFFPLADSLCVVSEALRREYLHWRSDIQVVPNGLSFPEGPPSAGARASAREKLLSLLPAGAASLLSRHPDAVWCLSLARIYPGKGHEQVLALWNALSPEARSGALLLFVGPAVTPMEAMKLEARIQAVKDNARVHYLGPSLTPDLWLSAAHIFLSGSEFEGMPLAPMEALGAGLPCLLSDIEGHRLVGESASFFPLSDPGKAAPSLEWLIDRVRWNSDGLYRERWNQAAEFRARHSDAAMVKTYEGVYRSVDSRSLLARNLPRMNPLPGLRRAFRMGMLALAFLFSAELGARADDWFHYRTPFHATPDRERDLVVEDSDGPRGRPHGCFRRWRLNAYGFRGGEISLEPSPDCHRIMVLGASETFGLHESEGREFPAQLNDGLRHRGCFEVINAAIPGMSLKSMHRYWHGWLAAFEPRTVIVYPSPMFYLDEEAPRLPRREAATRRPEPGPAPRLWSRAGDAYHQMPRWVKRWRESWLIATATAGKEPRWLFQSLPEDRLRLFAKDLERLVAALTAYGVRPILVTHAIRAAYPPAPDDIEAARSMRMFFPRATPEVILDFERAAAREVRALAALKHLPLVDFEASLSGHKEWFADLVHFNDAGAAAAATLIAEQVEKDGPRKGE